MRYLSVCSGIEAATCAWHPLGWQPLAFSEIEKFPAQVLAHHYPDVPNLGDMTKFNEWDDYEPDLLVGGTPCQSFSIAGLRKGLADPRGNLMLTYLAIADKYRPNWLVWENVPGVLSSNGGRDFGTFLGALGQLGYGWAYRILDAQYFGVAQRRRRVFVVASLGGTASASAVLFERHSLQGHPAPSREARKVAPTIPSRSTGGGGLGTDFDCDGGLIHAADVAPTLNAHFGSKMGLENQHIDGGGGYSLPSIAMCLNAGAMGRQDAETLIPTTGGGFDAGAGPTYGIPGNWIGRSPENGGNSVDPMDDLSPCQTKTDRHAVVSPIVVHGTQDPCSDEHVAFALGRNNGQENALAVSLRGREGGATAELGDEVQNCLRASSGGGDKPHVLSAMQVRRLTPIECERLQGFPDGYTDIMPNGKPTPDGQRYKALGNSMAVPVMHWIGKRIQLVEEIHKTQQIEIAA